MTTQSKKWLLEALLHFMGKKKYSEITIKEFTKQAGLDRKTCCHHFKIKDEILHIPIFYRVLRLQGLLRSRDVH